MGNLFIAATKKTPEIVFLNNGELQIKGSSIPEDALNFYKPLVQWLENYFQENPKTVTVTIDFEYINTSSTIHVIRLLNFLVQTIQNKDSLKIIWKFDPEDEDSFEQGEMIQKIIKHPMLMVKSDLSNL